MSLDKLGNFCLWSFSTCLFVSWASDLFLYKRATIKPLYISTVTPLILVVDVVDKDDDDDDAPCVRYQLGREPFVKDGRLLLRSNVLLSRRIVASSLYVIL